MSENLVVRAKRDGTWLEFKSGGKSAVLRMETVAEGKIGIIGMAIRGWCKDRQAEVAHACSRCGERIENGTVPDGCRDPDCPERAT
jgi:hypothetical protein